MRAEINFEDLARLEQNIGRLPGKAEDIINKALDKQASRIVVEHITKLIKTGDRPGRHANQGKWEKIEKFNLGFDVVAKGGAAKNKGSFGYLVFPNEGRGPRNPTEQRFAELGLEQSVPKVLEIINVEMEKKIQEVL